MGGASTHIGEVKYVQFIPQLAKSLLIKWLGEDIGKLIFGAHSLNANVSFLLVISYEMMVVESATLFCFFDDSDTSDHPNS